MSNENIVYIMLAFVLFAFAMLTVTFAYLYSQTNQERQALRDTRAELAKAWDSLSSNNAALRRLEERVTIAIAHIRMLHAEMLMRHIDPPPIPAELLENQQQRFVKRSGLAKMMESHLSFDEVETLIFDLNVPDGSLRGETKPRRIRELIKYARQNNVTRELLALLETARGDIEWPTA